MANVVSAFGLRPVRHISGAPYNGATVPCYIAPAYATALYVGDPVILTTVLAGKSSTMPTIIASAATDGVLIRGVIVSIEPNPDDLTKIYSPASTAQIAHVCMDPDVIYEIRGDGSGAPAAAMAGLNAEAVATTAGSTVTGLSGFNLDATTPATTRTFPLHILNIKNIADNELGDDVIFEVLLNTPENADGRFLGITVS
jgi:hypothetical protein